MYLQRCCRCKVESLNFLFKALTDGSSFICSGSVFQIHAQVNAKLFLNIEFRAVGISKSPKLL